MIAQEVARKYATALFLAVKEKEIIDLSYEQLTGLLEFIEKDNSLLNFLEAPQVLEEHKEEIIRTVFEKRLHQLIVEFLIVLVRKHRMAYLAGIIDDFIRLIEAEKGIARVTVITAKPVDEDYRSSLIDKLTAKTGMTIELEEKVDPKILGGMIVLLHDEIIDGSVRHELDLMKEQLSKVKVV